MMHRQGRGRQALPLTYDHSKDYYSYSKTYKPLAHRRLPLVLRRLVAFACVCVVRRGGRRCGGRGGAEAAPAPAERVRQTVVGRRGMHASGKLPRRGGVRAFTISPVGTAFSHPSFPFLPSPPRHAPPPPQVGLGFWLATPIIKAVRTTRTADHESESYFNLADG